MRFIEPAMRPPQEANSFLPRAMQGCTYNKCRFCYVSRGYPVQFVTEEELDREAERQRPFFRADTDIYMTGSNPFALPASRLKRYVEVLRRHFPEFGVLSMQARVDDISPKSDAELRELCGLGLSRLYIGVENGNDEVLKMMDKGYDSALVVQQLNRLDAAGIKYTTFYVLGLGGAGFGRASAVATAKMLNKVNPERVTTTGMTVFADTPLSEMLANGEYTEATEREKIEELKIFLENLEIDTFYDGIHYLNPLNYRFRTADSESKQAALMDMADILKNCSDEYLELMVNRRMMRSL